MIILGDDHLRTKKQIYHFFFSKMSTEELVVHLNISLDNQLRNDFSRGSTKAQSQKDYYSCCLGSYEQNKDLEAPKSNEHTALLVVFLGVNVV